MTFFNGAEIVVEFGGGCVKQEKITFHHGNMVNAHIVYEINLWRNDLNSKFIL